MYRTTSEPNRTIVGITKTAASKSNSIPWKISMGNVV